MQRSSCISRRAWTGISPPATTDLTAVLVERPGEDYGYAAFTSTVDALIMGSRTFELVATFDPWPYAGKLTFVCTSRASDGPEDVAFLSGEATVSWSRSSAGDRNASGLWARGAGELVPEGRAYRRVHHIVHPCHPRRREALVPAAGRVERLRLLSVKHFLRPRCRSATGGHR